MAHTKTEAKNPYAKMQGEAVLSAVKGVEMKDYSSDPIPAHQSVNLEFALGKLPEATAKNTTGLEAATDHLKAMAERHVGHKAEAGYGQDEGNWAINLAFQPEAKEALTKALPEIQKMTKKAAVQLNN